MRAVYTFKKGVLNYQKGTIPFIFGNVFEEDGVFHFEFYIDEKFDLAGLIKTSKNVFTDYFFSMKSQTVDLNILEATRLFSKTITPHLFKIEMRSEGYLLHTDVSSFPSNANIDILDMTLYYIEFEGLEMVHTDITEVSKTRRGEEINPWNNWERDHTPIMLMYEGEILYPTNFFHVTFFKSKPDNCVIAQFSNKNEKPPTPLNYKYFQSFKYEFLYFLSFLNGGEVKIKKEHLGGFLSSNGVKTQTELTYSYPSLGIRKTSGYIPINNEWYRNDYIVHQAFMRCFNNYIRLNKLLDFNSIIYYLNGAQQINSIDERFFISIIAFERLASNYADSFGLSDEYIISDQLFKSIRDELCNVINNNKEILGEGYSKILDKINNIHKIRAVSNRFKSFRLLEYGNIVITPEIKQILNKIRNTSIHRGEIGEGNEGIINYYVLDELIRDIILNLIDYKYPRNSSYRKITID